MGRMKDELMEPQGETCGECGAPIELNGDGEPECTNERPCLRQVEAEERRRS